MKNDDVELIQRVLAGDENAFSILVRKYQQEVGGATQLFKIGVGSRVKTQLTHNGDNSRADWFDPVALPVQPDVELLTTTWGKLKER